MLTSFAGQTIRRSNGVNIILLRNLSAQSQNHPQPQPHPLPQPKQQNISQSSSSFVQNIFCGQAQTQHYFPYPNVLNTEDLSFMQMIIDPLVRMYQNDYDALKAEETGVFDEKNLKLIRELGCFGIHVPQEYGGIGCNNTQFALMAHETAGYDLALGVMLASHQSIGYKGLLLYGTDEQKAKYLPQLASGEKIACFCLTEPSGGSDAANIKTRAELAADGKHWILNGSKIFISNGGIADYLTVFAQTPVKTSTGETKNQMTAFFIPRLPGVTSGPQMKKMGIRACNTTEVYFDNVEIPVENVIGLVGDGFKVAMNILNNGRYGMVGALAGTMKLAIEKAISHVNQRTQFGATLSTYSGIQEKITRMSMRHYVTQSMAYMLSGLMDLGMKDYQLEAAISKVYASDNAVLVVDECLQIFGGMGYMRETGVEKMLRDSRVFPVFEGANEVMRLFIALTGIQHAGGHLQEIQRAMKNPVANLGTILGEGSRRIRRSAGFTTLDLSSLIHQTLSQESKLLSQNIVSFGQSVEHLLVKHQRNIVHKQLQLNRLANAAIDIYTMMVVLSRATRSLNKNLNSAQVEAQMSKVICLEANARINQNLASIRSAPVLANDETIRDIAKNILANGGLVHSHPLD